MYNETLKKIISDFVSICGEDFKENIAKSELEIIEDQIKEIKKLPKQTSGDKMDLDVLEVRKENWLNSASYLGNKIINDFVENKNKEEMLENFNILYERVEKMRDEVNASLLESGSENIIDAINKLNIKYIKNKTKIVEDTEKVYSNIYDHYKQKKGLVENVLKTLEEKKMIVEEIIELYQNIIHSINEEIQKNNDDLLSFNEKKHLMAYALLPEKEYKVIEEETFKLRAIKLLNEKELKKFNEELERVLKEKESIQKEYSSKELELDALEVDLKEYKIKTENKEYVSKENEIDHNLDLATQGLKLRKLNLQKDLLYLDIPKMKEMAVDILSKPTNTNTLEYELEGSYTKEEINEMETLMQKYNITKKEAMETVEMIKQKEKQEKMVESYMDEFDFSKEEAKEAIKNDMGNKFWSIEEV